MENENTIPEPSLEESISLLLSKVPAPIRTFVLNDLQTKTHELMGRYNLHIDQGGILEQELLLMLLGQEQPAEFVTALQAAGIPAQTVQSLASDINTEIFMKLHAEESGVVASIPQPPAIPLPQNTWPATPPVTTPVPPTPPVQSVPRPPAAPVVPVPAYMPPPVAVPVPQTPVPSLSQFVPEPLFPTNPAPPVTPASSAPSVQVPRTMAQDMAAASAVENTVPATPTFAPSAAPVPEVSQAPKVVSSTNTPATATVASANRDALHAVLKEYGVDPYRELPD